MFKGILAGLAAGAFWGTTFLVAETLRAFSMVEVTLGRCIFFALASAVILAVNRKDLRRWMTPELLKINFWLSLAGYSLYGIFLTQGVRDMGITLVSVIIGLLPITLALTSQSRPTNRKLFITSLLAIVLGVFLLNSQALLKDGLTVSNPWVHLRGFVFATGCLLGWNWFALKNARVLQKNPQIDLTTWGSCMGMFSFVSIAVIYLVQLFLTNTPSALTTLVSPDMTKFYFWSALAGIGSSWIATLFWNMASVRLPTSLVGQLIVSETIFALIYGYIYHAQYPTEIELVSIIMMIVGICLGISSFKPGK